MNATLLAIRLAVRDLPVILEKMGVAMDAEIAAPLNGLASFEPENEETLPALDEVFDQESMKQLQSSNVDEFWDTLEQEPDDGSVINADAISYDQARQLGLAPDEEAGADEPVHRLDGVVRAVGQVVTP